MNKKNVRISALFVLISACAFAQKKGVVLPVTNELKEVVVTDSKFALPKEKSGKVIVKITADDLKKRPGQSVAEVLSTVAGVEINGNQSRNGKDLGVFIRGGRGHQVLILIDGVPVTDASGISLSYDLRLLSVQQVESIEVMKGAASTLYGSGAATGVINITLKKAAKNAISGNVYMNVGTQTDAKDKDYSAQDFNQGFSFNGKSEKFNYFASLNSTETTGISEAKPALDTETFEDDGFSRVNSIVKFGFTPNKKLSLDFFASYDRMRSQFDDSAFTDETRNNLLSVQYRLGFSPKFKYNKGELVLNAAASKIDRNYEIFSSWTNSVDKSLYQARNINADLFNKYKIIPELFMVTGGQFQFFEMVNLTPFGDIQNELAKFSIIDPYATVVYNSDFGLNINTGARLNIHSKYGSNFVFNINPSYSFSEIPLKLVTSYSTAYITPSLFQLYSPYGKLDLTPEKNSTIEAGFELALLDKKINLNSVAFYRQEQNSIGFVSSSYDNIEGKYNAKGVETMLSYTLSDKLKLSGNYTFTQVEEALSRLIPKHKANAAVEYQPTARTFFNVSYQYVDKRGDVYYDGVIFTSVPVALGSYQLLNATAKYELIKNKMTVFANATNILNKDFVEAAGYYAKGRNFKLGLNINL
ncbi:TonB-dependent receptor plug domain-containing protein [Flavobacterium undicola]|uniref:TonB-dependent receptor plug domain-containing protein n=1 Tax=Flavobacterium undicola TaxID=1932779 RepID=UPI001A9B0BC6|nr:TonB-dependent receptor plug domain-containing protein [Flavobacterium undicola]